ncbi:DNA polymerase III subunit beta [Edaphobacter dinghuensis]|uniref:Beta sliding clamp n=1 Tax=Edaphobacter dinghuensis TaxID=1560005 RepID=A0A917M8Z2_9BACT|nr:DNA polymerase III subunit beta [Edaphobacter dinghuensis]GGG86830.1 DNA polymerase III subunit beta [Edaphobacter dinghuensis]
MAQTPNTNSKTDTKLMELSVDRNTLLAEITAAARISESKGTQPILLYLLLEANPGGMLTITSTDLKRAFRTQCPAATKTPGKATVHAQNFLDYIKLLPEGPVHLKVLANDHLHVVASNSRTRMPGRAPSEFPKLPLPPAQSVRLSCRVLRTLVRQSLFAVSTSEDRYLLNAALLLLRPDRAGMVATDGHRLSFVVVPDDGIPVKDLQKSLLPRECLTDLLSLLSSTKEEGVYFSEDDANLFFQIGPRLLSVRKLVGQFPSYEGIMPKDLPRSTVIRTSELLTSIQRVLEFSDARSNGVKLHLEANTLRISSSAPDRGESEETLAVSYSADPVTIGFNGNYLVDFLRTVGEKGAMRLSLKDSDSAGLLVPENMSPEYQQQYVVMPMRI